MKSKYEVIKREFLPVDEKTGRFGIIEDNHNEFEVDAVARVVNLKRVKAEADNKIANFPNVVESVKALVEYHNKDLKVLIEAKEALNLDIKLPDLLDEKEYLDRIDISKLATVANNEVK